jgi:hypothetical protein
MSEPTKPAIEIVSGPLIRPDKTLIYGIEGVGKTTLISRIGIEFNRRILFLDTESGTRVDVERVHIRSMKDWDQTFNYLLKEKHPYDTVAIDTVTSAEPFVETIILEQKRTTSSGRKVTRMADYEFGKGSVYLREEFDRILYLQLDELIRLGITVILVGHAQIRRVNLPELIEGFDRYELAMDPKVAATLRQWCDNVLFCNWDFKITTNEADQPRGIAGKERVIYSQHAAAYDAKNRAGLAEKLKWDVKELTPLFARPAMAEKPVADAADPHKTAWEKLIQVAELGAWNGEVVTAFFKSRFPNFKGPADFKLIPLDYIERAIKRPEDFKVTINEFTSKYSRDEIGNGQAGSATESSTAETQPAAAL